MFAYSRSLDGIGRSLLLVDINKHSLKYYNLEYLEGFVFEDISNVREKDAQTITKF